MAVDDDDDHEGGSSSLLLTNVLFDFDIDPKSTEGARVLYSPKLFKEYDFNKRLSVMGLVLFSRRVVQVRSERSKSAYGLTLRGPEELCLLSSSEVTDFAAVNGKFDSVDNADSVAALQLNDLENCLEMELDGCRRYFSKIRSTRD